MASREVGVLVSLVGTAGLYVASENPLAALVGFSALILSNEFWRRAQNNWEREGGRGNICPDSVEEVAEVIETHHVPLQNRD